MGIFNDLGFSNRSGVIVSPDSKLFDGYTLDQVKAQIKPSFVYVDNSVDGQAIIQGSSLPTTILQQTSWKEYQPIAYNFQDSIINADTSGTVLLLNCDDFTDKTGKTITNNGVVIDTNTKKFGSGSWSFGGIQSATIASHTDFNIGTKDFTIECWVKKAVATDSIYILQMGNLTLKVLGNSCWNLQINGWNAIDAPSFNDNNWHFLVVQRKSGILDYYLDGIKQNSTQTDDRSITQGALKINYNSSNGYIDDLRITVGTARYSTNFTPPTTSFTFGTIIPKKLYINNVAQTVISETATIDTTSTHDIFGDGSCKATYQFNGDTTDLGGTYNGTATGITYGEGKFGQAAIFNGISDTSRVLLNYPWSGNSSAPLVISMWVYKDRLWAHETLFSRFDASAAVNGINLFAVLTNELGNWSIHNEYISTTTISLTSTISIPLSTWTHIAISIVDNTITLYTNGIISGTDTNTNWGVGARLQSNNPLYLGQSYAPDASTSHNMFKGKIDQVRIFNRMLTDYEISVLYKETKPSITTFEKTLTTENQLAIKVDGTVDSVELNFYEGV